MNKKQLERQFDEAFEEHMEQAPDVTPQADYRDSWNRLQPLLAKEKRKRERRSRLGMAVAIAGSLVLGGVIFNNTHVARAIEPLYASILELPSGLGSLIFGNPTDDKSIKAKTDAPPGHVIQPSGEEIEAISRQADISEAELPSVLAFNVPKFNYLPEGYSLYRIRVYYYGTENKADMVDYNFVHTSGAGLTVNFMLLKSDTAFFANSPKEGITTKTIDINGAPAIFSFTEQKHSTLETLLDNKRVFATGVLDEADIIHLFEGINFSS